MQHHSKALVSLIVCLMLMSCGGGGSGNNSTASLPPVPQNPPSLPAPQYSGLQTPAAIDQQTAVSLAISAISGVQTILTSAPSPYLPTGAGPVVNETVSGTQGGSALVQGRISLGGTGWAIETMTNYQYQISQSTSAQTFTENGKIVLLFQQGQSSGSTDITIGFSQMTLTSNNLNSVINGTVQEITPQSPDLGCQNYTGNLSFSNSKQSYLYSRVKCCIN